MSDISFSQLTCKIAGTIIVNDTTDFVRADIANFEEKTHTLVPHAWWGRYASKLIRIPSVVQGTIDIGAHNGWDGCHFATT